MTADFNGDLTCEMLEGIEYKANFVTAACKKIKAYYPDEEAIRGMEYRSKLDFYENVRIVEIEDTEAKKNEAEEGSFYPEAIEENKTVYIAE